MCELEYRKCGNEFTYKNVIFNGYTTLEQLEETCKFEFLPTDIVVSTFPRSGTAFTLEIVWQIKNRKTVEKGQIIKNPFSRYSFLEFDYKLMPELTQSFYQILNSQKHDPYRLIKTHVPYKFIKENLEKVNSKMIIVMRNAKDCLVSNYHHYHHPAHEWDGDFNDFFPIFLHGKTFSGSYFDNNIEWWSLRARENVLVLFYEELIINMPESVAKIATFLGEKLTEEEINKVIYNSSFATMSKNSELNYSIGENYKSMRKGIIGYWKEYFSAEQSQLLDEEIKKKFLGLDLEFIYE